MCVCSVYSCVCVRSTATLESASYVTPPCACITPRTLWWLRHTSTTWRLGVPVAAHASPFSGGPTDQAPSCCAYRGCHTLLLCLPWVPHPLAVLTVGATPSCCAYRGCHTLLLCLPWVPHPLGKHVRGASQPPQPTATQQPVKVLEALAGCCAVHLCADTRLSAAGLPPQRRCPCIISVRSLLPSTLRSLLLSTLTSTRPPARAASRSRPSTRPLPSSTSPRTARWRPWAARTWSCSCGALRPGSC